MKKLLGLIFDSESLVGRLLLVVIYCIVYDFMYNDFVYFFFYYLNLDESLMDVGTRFAWLMFSVIPIVFFHKIESISSFLTIFLYLLVYIPFIHALFISSEISFVTTYVASIILCLLFVMYFSLSSRKPILKDLKTTPAIPFRWVEYTALALTVLIITLRAGAMHFVNVFTEIDLLYERRIDNSEAVEGMGFIPYIMGWLSGAFYPFLLISYLKSKRFIKAVCILAGYFALFMVDMQKLTFFMPFVIMVIYVFLKYFRYLFSNILHSSIIVTVIIISLLLNSFKEDELIFGIGSIFLLRTVCVADWLSQYYLRFFEQNPFTYYGHINIVNAVTGNYPYNEPLGIVVAYGSQNANANFLLTDGYAAAGLVGVVFIGLFFYFLLMFLNSISYRYGKTDLYVVMVPALSYFLNTSIFTTFLTSGFLILIILIMGSDNPLIEDDNIKEYSEETDLDNAINQNNENLILKVNNVTNNEEQ